MPQTVDDLSIVNEALARLGSSPIFSLEEESKTAGKAARIYPTVVGTVFAAHSWNFARRTTRLDRLAVVPETGWAFAYALPGNRIGDPVKVLDNPRSPDNPLRMFLVEGDELHADAAAVWATCVRQVAPADWPPLFKSAVVVALAAELCVPQSHDVNLAAALRQEAWGSPAEGLRGGQVGRAMARDAASTPGPAPLGASDALTDAWHGGF